MIRAGLAHREWTLGRGEATEAGPRGGGRAGARGRGESGPEAEQSHRRGEGVGPELGPRPAAHAGEGTRWRTAKDGSS